MRQLAVAREQRLLFGGLQPEFGIGGDAFEFRQTFRVGKALQTPVGQAVGQRDRAGIAEMQQIHDDIGIEDEPVRNLWHERARYWRR